MENHRFFLAALLVGLSCFVGCEEKPEETGEIPAGGFLGDPTQVELRRNGLEGLPGEVYRSQTDSPIHWQPWTEESLEYADKAGRLVFAVIVMPQQPTFKTVLAKMQSNQRIVDAVNQNYVPILIDGNASREMGILCVDLCAEIKVGLQLPLMLWMTSEGNPVAWIPIPGSEDMSLEGLFMQSHSMVSNVWEDDQEYVFSNSRLDQKNRRSRLKERLENRELSDDPAQDAVRALRQLTAIYDPLTRTLDQAGGLFPVGSLELLSTGVQMEGLPESVRQKSRTVLGDLLSDILPSAMFDPLDGGAFSSKMDNSWDLPRFYRDSATQARIVSSLMKAYEATGDERARERALGVLGFVEENFKTPEGLFSMGSEYRGPVEKWLWQMEEIQQVLTDDELEVWKRASGIEETGNLLSETDPLRQFLHSNSLRNSKSAKEVSEETGMDLKAVDELLSSSRRKLLKARDERMEPGAQLAEPDSAASLQMASAYVAAYQATGEEVFKKRAVETIEKAKQQFSDGPRLQSYPGDAPDNLTAARAFVYALAIHASLDVAAITSDDSWLFWADDLATTTAEIFMDDEFLLECPHAVNLIDLPIVDSVMIFGDSTAGLIAQAEARMKGLGRPITASLGKINTGLPLSATSNPVIYTDLIQAALIREYGETDR